MFNFPQAGADVQVADLLRLNEALRANARKADALRKSAIGYVTPQSGGGDLGPLVPQSIEGMLPSATSSDKQLSLWPRIDKAMVGSTVHEVPRILDHGLDIDPFFSEGGVGVENGTVYDKIDIKIRYLYERRSVTDVATMVGLVGPNPQALAEATQAGTRNLLRNLERRLWHSKAGLSGLHFSGLIEQIKVGAPKNVTDLRGKVPTPNLLQNIVGAVFAAPLYGEPDTAYVETRVYTALVQYANQFGRHDLLKSPGQGQGVVRWGPGGLVITAPYGDVQVVAAPFLYRSHPAPSAASSASAPAVPALTGGGAIAAGAHASSKFIADDAGDYIYKAVAVSLTDDTGGYSAPLTTAAVTVAAGDRVTFTINNPAGVDYYRIYRSTKNGDATTCILLGEFPVNVLGDGGKTLIADANHTIPGTSEIVFVSHDPTMLQFYRLLDLTRRPIPVPKTKHEFLLMLFGSPLVKVATKCWMVENAGSPEPTELVQS